MEAWSRTNKIFPFSDFDKTEFIELLESIDGVLLLRPHVNDLAYHELREFLDFLCKDNDRIRFCTHNEVIDVNTILPAIDLLVTDWCSIEHDYILLNRPILYIPYDYHDFKKNNGFYMITMIIYRVQRLIHSRILLNGLLNFMKTESCTLLKEIGY